MPEAELEDINLNGIRNVANAAVTNRVKQFVQASSVAASDPYQVKGKTGVTEDIPIGKGNSKLYYWNGKASAERTLAEILAPTQIVLTLLRPTNILGPLNRVTVPSFRQNAVKFPGKDPRTQFVHEDDVASAFLQAVLGNMPGAFNVVPDDFIYMSEFFKLIGATPVPTIPLWLARLVTWIRWRYFGGLTHPSWVDAMAIDATASNEKLKSTGWAPAYNCAEAIRSAL
jgi:nucleoside-diphosphate-sugar epimerase